MAHRLPFILLLAVVASLFVSCSTPSPTAALITPPSAAPLLPNSSPHKSLHRKSLHRKSLSRKLTPRPCLHRCVYLTFDDGPWTLTPRFVHVLLHRHVRATFFLVGDNIDAFKASSRALNHSLFSLQNHSWDHADLTTLNTRALVREIKLTQHKIRQRFHRTAVCLRPPYGATSPALMRVLHRQHLRPQLWTVDPQDWARPGSSRILHRILASVRPGAVILMHDGGGDRSQTLRQLPVLIHRLRQQHYHFGLIC